MAKSELDEFVQNDVKKQKGVYIPVQVGLTERLTTKHLPIEKLHPNPDDEFAFPDIGPNYQIISKYVEDIKLAYWKKLEPFDDDPIIVEKLHPDGYLIINGHHRWAAAVRMGMKKIRAKIVNLALESDIKKIIEKSKHNKRATLDLDEVVFKTGDEKTLEKALPFPYNLRYRQRIRLGIPALFYALSKMGYDIWVYSSNYYSIDDIRDFFSCYHVYVDGIITGLAKKNARTNKTNSEIESMMSAKYGVTLHIDNDMLLRTEKSSGEFEEHDLDVPPEEWAKKAITIIEKMERDSNSAAYNKR